MVIIAMTGESDDAKHLVLDGFCKEARENKRNIAIISSVDSMDDIYYYQKNNIDIVVVDIENPSDINKIIDKTEGYYYTVTTSLHVRQEDKPDYTFAENAYINGVRYRYSVILYPSGKLYNEIIPMRLYNVVDRDCLKFVPMECHRTLY